MSFTPTCMFEMLSKESTEYRFNVKGVESVLCIQGPLTPQEGRLIVAISPVGLSVHQSKEAAL